MPRGRMTAGSLTGAARELEVAVRGLQQQRQEYVNGIADIDALFAQLGIQPQEGKPRGRPPKAGRRGPGRPRKADTATKAPKAGGRRKRRKFAIPAHESVLQFAKGGGKDGRTSKEIAKHWKEESRSGQPFVTLGQLVKAKKLKKQELKGQRGSRYTAV